MSFGPLKTIKPDFKRSFSRLRRILFIINLVEGELMNQSSSQQNKHQYDYVPAQKRLTLIKMVTQGTTSIGKAAIELGIKLSTAKLIVKKFRTTGRIYVSKKEREQQKQSNGQQEEVRQQLNAYNAIKDENSEIENEWAHYQTPCLYNCYDSLPLLYTSAPIFFYYF